MIISWQESKLSYFAQPAGAHNWTFDNFKFYGFGVVVKIFGSLVFIYSVIWF